MRISDSRLGRFLSVDPITKKYPELTPYQFASNTPIWAIDLDGLEAYFSTNGTFVKWGNDKTDKAPVFVVDDKKVETKLTLNFKEFLDRAQWFYGEGGRYDAEDGTKMADAYAHATQNLKEHGANGTKPYESEEALKGNWRDDKHSYAAKTIQTGNDDYTSFNTARQSVQSGTDVNALNNLPDATKVIKALIDQQTGASQDPTIVPGQTQGGYRWVGNGGTSSPIQNNPTANNAKNTKTFIIKTKWQTRYATFYQNLSDSSPKKTKKTQNNASAKNSSKKQ